MSLTHNVNYKLNFWYSSSYLKYLNFSTLQSATIRVLKRNILVGRCHFCWFALVLFQIADQLTHFCAKHLSPFRHQFLVQIFKSKYRRLLSTTGLERDVRQASVNFLPHPNDAIFIYHSWSPETTIVTFKAAFLKLGVATPGGVTF